MLSHMQIPTFILNGINSSIRKRCEESGHVCPFWVNEQIMDDLLFLDKKDNGNRALTYFNQCHSVEIIYRPSCGNHPMGLEIRCQRNNMALGNYWGEDCKYCNEKVKTEVQEDIENFLKGCLVNDPATT